MKYIQHDTSAPSSRLIAWAAASSALLLSSAALQSAPTVQFQGSNSGIFTNPDTGVVTGVGTNHFTWGDPGNFGTGPSSFTFTGASFDVPVETGYIFGPRARNNREVFSLGRLDYFNGTITDGANSVMLENRVTLAAPVGAAGTFAFPLQLINSPNTEDPIASADIVNLPTTFSPTVLRTPGGAPVTLELVGFGDVTGGGFSTTDRFFVLEGASASASLLGRFAPPCEPIVTGGISVTASGATMSASFTPNFQLKLADAAALCGYDHFNWYQVISADPHPPGGQTVPYTDPPFGGGPAFGGFADNLPFYWDEEGSTGTGYHLFDNTTMTSLSYSDTPAEPGFLPGEKIDFTTTLAGVLPDGTWDALYAFSWSTNYNGTSGGVSTRRNLNPTDPGTGTGGAFNVARDLNPEDISLQVRQLMIAQGARNVPLNVVVPEPGTALFGLAVATVAGLGRRSKRRTAKDNLCG